MKLKKFDLLIESILKDDPKDCRFYGLGSGTLDTSLLDSEKLELTKKYDEIVKNELTAAKNSNNKIKVYCFSPLSYNEDKMGVIKAEVKVGEFSEKNGVTYCRLLLPEYEDNKKKVEEESETEEFKEHYKNASKKYLDEWKDWKINQYTLNLPLYQIVTETVYKMLMEKEEELKHIDSKDSEKVLNNLPDDIKSFIEQGFLSKDEVISLLAVKKGCHEKIKLKNVPNKIAFSDEYMKKFKITKTNDYYETLNSSNRDHLGEYFYGRTVLNLYVIFKIEDGEKFDLNRLSYFLTHDYYHKPGYGTDN